MKACNNCGEQIDVNAKFCTYCGAKMQAPEMISGVKHSAAPKEPQPKLNDNLEKISEHLEFLGYKLEKIKAKHKDSKDLIIATHIQKNNLVIISITPTMSLFKIQLTTKKRHVAEMDAFVNDANKALVFAKFYTEIDSESKEVLLVLEAMYTGDYDKESFAEFIECFNGDANLRLVRVPGCDKLFLDN
jgi:hypothetical protein